MNLVQKLALAYSHATMTRCLRRNFRVQMTPTDKHPDPAKSYMLYAHVPFCHTFCPYCSFHKYAYDEGLARGYFEALRAELRAIAAKGFDFKTMVVGGGTTLINEDELLRTLELCKRLFSITQISCETDPNHIDPAQLVRFRGLIDRLSCGVQSFDDGILRKVARLTKFGSGEMLREKLSRAIGILPVFSIDLIFNFPSQTRAQLEADLDTAAALAPEQITTYPLMKSNLTKAKIAQALGVSAKDNEYAFYRIICERLAAAGYAMNNAWSFARRDFGGASAGIGTGVGGATGLDFVNSQIRPNEQNNPNSNLANNDREFDKNFTNKNNPNSNLTGADGANNGDNSGATDGGDPRALKDEYVSAHHEYIGVGSGAFSFVGGQLVINAFDLADYARRVGAGGEASIARARFGRRDFLRYIFLTEMFDGGIDVAAFDAKMGCDLRRELGVELLGLRAAGAVRDVRGGGGAGDTGGTCCGGAGIGGKNGWKNGDKNGAADGANDNGDNDTINSNFAGAGGKTSAASVANSNFAGAGGAGADFGEKNVGTNGSKGRLECTAFGRYLFAAMMKDFYAGMDIVRAVFRDDARLRGKAALDVMRERLDPANLA